MKHRNVHPQFWRLLNRKMVDRDGASICVCLCRFSSGWLAAYCQQCCCNCFFFCSCKKKRDEKHSTHNILLKALTEFVCVGFFARYFSQRDCDNDEANHLWLLLLLLLHRHSPNASKKWEMCEQEGKEIMTVIAKKVPGANLTSFMWARVVFARECLFRFP